MLEPCLLQPCSHGAGFPESRRITLAQSRRAEKRGSWGESGLTPFARWAKETPFWREILIRGNPLQGEIPYKGRSLTKGDPLWRSSPRKREIHQFNWRSGAQAPPGAAAPATPKASIICVYIYIYIYIYILIYIYIYIYLCILYNDY